MPLPSAEPLSSVGRARVGRAACGEGQRDISRPAMLAICVVVLACEDLPCIPGDCYVSLSTSPFGCRIIHLTADVVVPFSDFPWRTQHARRHSCRRSGEDLRRRTGSGRRRPRRSRGHRARSARAERRRQDHRRPGSDHPAATRQRPGRRGRPRRAQAAQRGAQVDRPVGAVRRRRRVPHRPGEPPDGRPALPDDPPRGEEHGPSNCWSASTSPTPPTGPPRPTRAACAVASTSPPRSWSARR